MKTTQSFLLGVAAGAVGLYISQKSVPKTQYISSEKVLKKVKAVFKAEGNLSGAWIEMRPQSYVKKPFTYDVYRGGVQADLGTGTMKPYEFIADCKTGIVLDVYPLPNS